jgi:hypothetical protein
MHDGAGTGYSRRKRLNVLGIGRLKERAWKSRDEQRRSRRFYRGA